jgi:hypothetical protein
MANRRRIIPTVIAAALMALCLPLMAAAQGNYDPWHGDDHRYDASDRYNRNRLRDTVGRVKKRSKDFQKHLDRALDHSRYDDGRFEDHTNKEAREFRDAADDLKDHLGDARNLNRSANQARKLLQLGAHLDRFISRTRLDPRVHSDWAQIRQDLRIIADVYGFNMADFDHGYYRSDERDYRRNDGYYRRPSNYPGVNYNHSTPWNQLAF